MVFDWRTRGRVHPAYVWGLGAMVAMAALIELVARIPAFVAFGARITG